MPKNIEFIEILITCNISKEKDNIIQTFSFDKKFIKYLTNPMYLLYDKIERKIREKGLDFIFSNRINDGNKIILIYEADSDDEIKKSFMFKIVDFIPPTNGCEFCKYKEIKNEMFSYCELKNRTLTRDIKKCSFFKQKGLYKT